jgi:hypothetical protein
MKKLFLVLLSAFSLPPSAIVFAGTNASMMFNTNTLQMTAPNPTNFYAANAAALAAGLSNAGVCLGSSGGSNTPTLNGTNLCLGSWTFGGTTVVSNSVEVEGSLASGAWIWLDEPVTTAGLVSGIRFLTNGVGAWDINCYRGSTLAIVDDLNNQVDLTINHAGPVNVGYGLTVSGGLTNQGAYVQSNTANGANLTLTTNAHFTAVDELGNSNITRTWGGGYQSATNTIYDYSSNGSHYVSGQYNGPLNGNASSASTVPASGINGAIAPSQLNGSQGGTPGPTTYYRGDGAWASPAGGGSGTATNLGTNLNATNFNIVSGTVPASTVSGTISPANLPTNSPSAAVSEFVHDLQSMNLYSNLLVAAWFAPGQNWVAPSSSNGMYNVTGIVQNPNNNLGPNGLAANIGVALNAIQTNSGLYLTGTNSGIIFSNIPVQSGAMSLMVFYTTQGAVNQANGEFYVGGFCNGNYMFAADEGGGMTAFWYTPTNDIGLNSSNSPSALNDWFSHVLVLSRTPTNFSIYEWYNMLPQASYNSNWMVSTGVPTADTYPFNELIIGAGRNQSLPMAGIVHGFIAFSNSLSLAQAQQLFLYAQHSGVLQWRRLCFDGDSLAQNFFSDESPNAYGTLGLPLQTNAPFWGNCIFTLVALQGRTVGVINNSFYPCLSTNLPNGNDIVFPSVVLESMGANNAGILGGAANCSAAAIEAAMSWEINAVHSANSKIYIPTLMFNPYNVGTTNTNTILAVNSWLRTGASGADGIADWDMMFSNLLGSTYYLNTNYFKADGAHPSPNGIVVQATNFAALVGTNLFAPLPEFRTR